MRRLVTSCIALFLLTTINGNVDAFKTYSQYQLWRLYAANDKQVEKLRDFSRVAYQHNVSFWTERLHVHVPVGFRGTSHSLFIVVLD